MEDLPETETTSIVSASCCPKKGHSKSRSRRRRHRRKSKGGSKCRKFRGGKKTRNAFLNFLRAYRKKCCGRNVKEIAKRGAKLWNSMTTSQKAPYFKIACSVPKRKRIRGMKKRRSRRKSRPCPKKGKRSSSSRKRRKSSSKKRKKSTPPCPC